MAAVEAQQEEVECRLCTFTRLAPWTRWMTLTWEEEEEEDTRKVVVVAARNSSSKPMA